MAPAPKFFGLSSQIRFSRPRPLPIILINKYVQLIINAGGEQKNISDVGPGCTYLFIQNKSNQI